LWRESLTLTSKRIGRTINHVSAAHKLREHLDEGSPIRIVAIAGSAGALDAMCKILPSLPADFPAPILYFQHMTRSTPGALAEVLQWHTPLKVRWAQQGDRLRAGVVLICPYGCSTVVHPNGTVTMTRTLTRAGLDRGIDQLFASVAASFAQRAVVLVLSGAGWDGGDGVCAVRAQNGIVLVQDQTPASQASMLRTPIPTGCADLVLRLEDIAPVLVSLVRDGYPLATLRRSAAAMVSGRSSPIPTVLRDTLDQLLATALWIHGTE